ncbi:MAG: hypothetical protein AABX51_05500 [Nanoarchaeota archaeon]
MLLRLQKLLIRKDSLPRRVLIPESIDSKLERIAERPFETSGFLFYEENEKLGRIDNLVRGMYITGVGNKSSVKAEMDCVRVTYKFLETHHEYRIIDWHTHPRGLPHASPIDMQTISEHMEKNPARISLIIGRGESGMIATGYGTGQISAEKVLDPADRQYHEVAIRRGLNSAAQEIGMQMRPKPMPRGFMLTAYTLFNEPINYFRNLI